MAYAVSTHNTHLGVPHKSTMDKALLAADELTGFIIACCLVRPEGIRTLEAKSVKKKLKDKAFAAKVDREEIRRGAELLGVELDQHIQFVIDALKPYAEELRIAGEAMRLAWTTDVHLNHATNTVQHKFYQAVKDRADALLLTGDIAESPTIGRFLPVMAMVADRPIYFVLGNHDYYRGSIADTQFYVAQLAGEAKDLVYLNLAGIVELTLHTALVGNDGWADARLGNFERTGLILNDFRLIDADIGLSYNIIGREVPGGQPTWKALCLPSRPPTA